MCGPILVAFFALVVGGHDFVLSADLQTRASAGSLLVAGAIILASAIHVWRDLPRTYLLGLLASVISGAVALFFGISQLADQNVTPLLGLWGVAFAGSLVCAWLVHSSLPPAEWSLSIKATPVLSSLISLGALAALLQFWYSSIYLPGSAEPSLSVAPSLAAPSFSSQGPTQARVIKATIRMDNASSEQVNVVGGFYLVYGTRVTAPASAFDMGAAILAANDNGPPVTLFGRQQRTLVGYGRVLPDGTVFQPGQSETLDITILLPAADDQARYSVTSLNTYLFVARPTLVVGDETRRPDDSEVVDTSPVQDHSWLHSLTRGHQYLRVAYSTDPTKRAPVNPQITRYRGRFDSSRYAHVMNRVYGLSLERANAEIVLPVKNQGGSWSAMATSKGARTSRRAQSGR